MLQNRILMHKTVKKLHIYAFIYRETIRICRDCAYHARQGGQWATT